MIGFENYASRGFEIRDRLAHVLADEADADINARGAMYKWQDEADKRITEWVRAPGQAVTPADDLCQEALENVREIERERADRREARTALREVQDARPATDPSIAVLNLRDAVTGHLYAVTLRADQVERIIVNRLTM